MAMKKTDMLASDRARQNLAKAIEISGISKRALSLAVGKNPAYIDQFIKKRSPIFLPEIDRKIIAEKLHIPETMISGLATEMFPAASVQKRQPLQPISQAQPPVADIDLMTHFPIETQAGMLPVFGSVQGGGGGVLITGVPESWIERPGLLRGRSTAFALRVSGTSMAPKYEAGDVVMVNPERTPVQGSYVVIAIDDEGGTVGYIKQFVSQTKDELVVRQFNPAKELRFPLSSVTTLGVVTGSIEGR